MIKNIVKTAIVASDITLIAPTVAVAMDAPDWSAGTMLSNGASDAGMTIMPVNSDGANNWVIGIAKWLAGIAIVCFVLRVVMTAVDRMVLGNIDDGMQNAPRTPQSDGFRLSDIPVIGAYPPNVSWKQVWINFAKNLAIVVGVYIIIELIMGVVLWLIGVTSMQSVQ